jgi:hypothetical protein
MSNLMASGSIINGKFETDYQARYEQTKAQLATTQEQLAEALRLLSDATHRSRWLGDFPKLREDIVNFLNENDKSLAKQKENKQECSTDSLCHWIGVSAGVAPNNNIGFKKGADRMINLNDATEFKAYKTCRGEIPEINAPADGVINNSYNDLIAENKILKAQLAEVVELLEHIVTTNLSSKYTDKLIITYLARHDTAKQKEQTE